MVLQGFLFKEINNINLLLFVDLLKDDLIFQNLIIMKTFEILKISSMGGGRILPTIATNLLLPPRNTYPY